MSEHGGKTYRPWEPQRYQHEAHSPASKLPEGDLIFSARCCGQVGCKPFLCPNWLRVLQMVLTSCSI